MNEIALAALAAARDAGATFADVRVARYRVQTVRAKDRRVESLQDSESYGFGVRVLRKGAWGFAASDRVHRDEACRIARRAADIADASASAGTSPVRWVGEPKHVDVWKTPHRLHPFAVPLDSKISLLLRANDAALRAAPIKTASSFLSFESEDKLYANTEGSEITQEIVRTHAGLVCVAVGDQGFESRSYQVPALNTGYEHVDSVDLVRAAPRIADEAVQKLRAPRGPVGVARDLILLPSHLMLTIHESVAHPTELDRALGWEADYAGTTFCTLDRLGTLRYGSRMMNILADRTMPGARSTCGYDDDGVKTRSWYLVKDGFFVGYQTTRDTAPFLGEERSNGCSYADSWENIQFLRIPNVSLEANPKGPSLNEIISDTEDGILIDGRGSYSIDQQRLNFQFGGDAFWEVKKGKRGKMLRDVTYHANTLDFWSKLDLVGNPSTWEAHGVTNDGKGQPSQRGQQTHGAPAARFRGIDVGGAFKS
jgi:TldD protein